LTLGLNWVCSSNVPLVSSTYRHMGVISLFLF
jgi:hypothetical protein